MLALAATLAVAGQLLGGGSVGPAVTADHLDVDFATIRVAKDAKSIHFYGDWPARCGDGSVVTANVDRVVKLQPDGSFLAAGLLSTPGTVGTFQLQGQLKRDGASGTGSAELSSRGTNPTTCKTPSVSWRVRPTPRVTGAPAPKPGAAYFGSNDQTDPVVLRVAKDGRSIVQAGIEFGLDCRYYRFRFASDVIPGTPIGADGRFAKVQRYSSVLAASRYRGAAAHFTATLSGRFGASTVGGSLKVEVRILKGNAVIDTCRSTTAFAASR